MRHFILAIIISFSCNIAIAAELPQIELIDPTSAFNKIEKESDLSAAMFSRLFGVSWHEINGTSSDARAMGLGGFGRYSGLIVSTLGVLNLAAMAFVSAAIIYMWGIFAVTTAHESEKLGGSSFASQANSLWLPVRHASAFSMTVPVLNGLSILQIAIIACIGLAINFANRVWDTSGEYISKHANLGVMDGSLRMLENEVWNALPVMFETSAIQFILLARDLEYSKANEWQGKSSEKIQILSKHYKTPMGEEIEGRLYVRYNTKEGFADISGVPIDKILANNLGKIRISYPADSGKSQDQASRRIKQDLADIRIQAITNFWFNTVFPAAMDYLSSSSSGNQTLCVFPINAKKCADPINPNTENAKFIKAVNRMINDINTASASKIAAYLDANKDISKRMALSIDSDNGKSRLGWLSAGLFTFSLASMQKQFNDSVLTRATAVRGAGKDNIDKSEEVYLNETGRFMRKIDEKIISGLDPAQNKAYDNIERHLAQIYLQQRRYSSDITTSKDDSAITRLGNALIGSFVKPLVAEENTYNKNESMLAVVLGEFSNYDPIVVMQSFGERILGVLGAAAVLSMGVTAILGGVMGAGLVAMLMLVGALFAYVVPITPVIFWLRAVLSWVYMVVEVMVAAPFWACAHALPEGAGFAGEHARRGYMMLLNIVVRPTLLVIGAVFAIAIVQACGWLYNIVFNSWFSIVGVTTIKIDALADITYTIVVMSTMYFLSFVVFTKGINYLPDRILKWCGDASQRMGLGDEDESTAAIIAAGGIYYKTNQGLAAGMGVIDSAVITAKRNTNAFIQDRAAKYCISDIGSISSSDGANGSSSGGGGNDGAGGSGGGQGSHRSPRRNRGSSKSAGGGAWRDAEAGDEFTWQDTNTSDSNRPYSGSMSELDKQETQIVHSDEFGEMSEKNKKRLIKYSDNIGNMAFR